MARKRPSAPSQSLVAAERSASLLPRDLRRGSAAAPAPARKRERERVRESVSVSVRVSVSACERETTRAREWLAGETCLEVHGDGVEGGVELVSREAFELSFVGGGEARGRRLRRPLVVVVVVVVAVLAGDRAQEGVLAQELARGRALSVVLAQRGPQALPQLRRPRLVRGQRRRRVLLDGAQQRPVRLLRVGTRQP